MRVAVVGLGYVGLVTATCLARLGQTVVGLERDRERLKTLLAGEVPYFEPHLAPDLSAQLRTGNLEFTEDAGRALSDADVVMICVGTPSDEAGRANLSDVLAVTTTIGEAASNDPVVALRSTVPVGTTRRVQAMLNEARRARGLDAISVLANPEFLRTGRAIDDFLRPTRVVIGSTDDAGQHAIERLTTLYAPLEAPIVLMDAESAELVKNASNSFLAMRVSFVNELAALCDAAGASIDAVVEGMAHDPRIGGQFMRPGLGYGGSCLPKDVRSLMAMGRDRGLDMPLIHAVDSVNSAQVGTVADRLARLLQRPITGARIAVLGLAFKPDTDDIRDSAAIALATELQARGASVVATDPQARERVTTQRPSFEITNDALSAASGADAVVLATEWPEFVTIELEAMAKVMRGDLVVDARNALDPDSAIAAGLRYVGVGRGDVQGQSEAAA